METSLKTTEFAQETLCAQLIQPAVKLEILWGQLHLAGTAEPHLYGFPKVIHVSVGFPWFPWLLSLLLQGH